MRNLLEYPITTEEIVAELEAVKAEWLALEGAEFRCGAMRPLLLDAAIASVKEMPDILIELKTMLKNVQQLTAMLEELQRITLN